MTQRKGISLLISDYNHATRHYYKLRLISEVQYLCISMIPPNIVGIRISSPPLPSEPSSFLVLLHR